MAQLASQESTFASKLKKLAHNIKFKFNGLLQFTAFDDILAHGETLYLLGVQYSSKSPKTAQVASQIETHFKSVIWITYRTKFPSLLKKQGSMECFSDAGWGCMIRAGQMAFAEVIKTFRKSTGKKELVQVCGLFNDCREDSPFSIQNISRMGLIKFKVSPGEWYNLSQITFILSDLLNQTKLPQLQGLRSLVFNDSTLFFDQILRAFQPQPILACTHNNKGQLICTECFKSQQQVSIIIMTRLGFKCPQPQYLQILNTMMSWKWFKGLIGGRDKSALYFIGRKDNQYVYLDPHYVQNAHENVESIGETYFCESWRSCKNTSIDPSLGISFYLDSLHSLNEFHCSVKQLKQQKQTDFFIYSADSTPECMSQVAEFEKEIEKSCEFQLI